MQLTQAQIDALPVRRVRRKSHLPYDVAKNQIPDHVTSIGKYQRWVKESKSYFMPAHPERVYPNFSWSDFLGREIKDVVALVAERRNRVYRPLWDAVRWAQAYCRRNGLVRETDWEAHYETASDIPEDIPKHPKHAYADQDYPGFRIWCGRDATGIAEAAQHVTPILTLCHPVNSPQNVLQLVSWPGIGELREQWRKQSDFDRILGTWKRERELMPQVDQIMAHFGQSDGERVTVTNVNALTWELNSLLEMVKLA